MLIVTVFSQVKIAMTTILNLIQLQMQIVMGLLPIVTAMTTMLSQTHWKMMKIVMVQQQRMTVTIRF